MRVSIALLSWMIGANVVAGVSPSDCYDLRCTLKTEQGGTTQAVFRINEGGGGVNEWRALFTPTTISFKLKRDRFTGPFTVYINRVTGALLVYTPTKEVFNSGVCVRVTESNVDLTRRSSGPLSGR